MTIPRRLIDSIRAIALRIEEQVESLTELGFDLAEKDRHHLDMVGVDCIHRVVLHLESEPEDATINRLKYVLSEGEAILNKARRIERKMLVSQSLSESLSWRIRQIEPKADSATWEAFSRWNEMRTNDCLFSDLRNAYCNMLVAVASAEEIAAEKRVRAVMAQVNAPSPKKHRGGRSSSQRRTSSNLGPAKGRNETPPKHGGFGTSKKSKQKRRKRELVSR